MLKYAFSHKQKEKNKTKHNRKSFCGHRNKPNTLLAPRSNKTNKKPQNKQLRLQQPQF